MDNLTKSEAVLRSVKEGLKTKKPMEVYRELWKTFGYKNLFTFMRCYYNFKKLDEGK